MSNENKQPPRRPDFEADYVRVALWDNRKDGGQLKFQISGSLKDAAERLQEAKDKARDDGNGNRREAARDDKRGSGREDRPARDAGPRYER